MPVFFTVLSKYGQLHTAGEARATTPPSHTTTLAIPIRILSQDIASRTAAFQHKMATCLHLWSLRYPASSVQVLSCRCLAKLTCQPGIFPLNTRPISALTTLKRFLSERESQGYRVHSSRLMCYRANMPVIERFPQGVWRYNEVKSSGRDPDGLMGRLRTLP